MPALCTLTGDTESSKPIPELSSQQGQDQGWTEQLHQHRHLHLHPTREGGGNHPHGAAYTRGLTSRRFVSQFISGPSPDKSSVPLSDSQR